LAKEYTGDFWWTKKKKQDGRMDNGSDENYTVPPNVAYILAHIGFCRRLGPFPPPTAGKWELNKTSQNF
jgi:hypothetical protein